MLEFKNFPNEVDLLIIVNMGLFNKVLSYYEKNIKGSYEINYK